MQPQLPKFRLDHIAMRLAPKGKSRIGGRPFDPLRPGRSDDSPLWITGAPRREGRRNSEGAGIGPGLIRRPKGPIWPAMGRRNFLPGDLPLKVLAVVGIPILVILLPVMLPIALARDALSERRLGRTRCANCNTVIGDAEVRRAKQAAGEEARNRIAGLISRGLIPRVVTIWRITCPACGAAYQYRHDPAKGLEPRDAS